MLAEERLHCPDAQITGSPGRGGGKQGHCLSRVKIVCGISNPE
jgi:hypothetical protein